MLGKGLDFNPNQGAGGAGNPFGGGNGSNWGQAAGGIGQLLASLFGGNTSGDSQDSIHQGMQQIQQNLQPWSQAGLNTLPDWQKQLQQLTSNPGGFINGVGQNYKQSPGLQFQIGQGTQAANNAAAAGGMAGSPQSQQYASEVSGNLANKDYYNYLSTALGQYGAGLGGLHDLTQLGQQASLGQGEDMANLYNQLAQFQYAGNSNQQQGIGGGLGSILGAVGSFFGF